jgi:hypothetical protein
MLLLKINYKNKKYIILKQYQIKNNLKNNFYCNFKYYLNIYKKAPVVLEESGFCPPR